MRGQYVFFWDRTSSCNTYFRHFETLITLPENINDDHELSGLTTEVLRAMAEGKTLAINLC